MNVYREYASETSNVSETSEHRTVDVGEKNEEVTGMAELGKEIQERRLTEDLRSDRDD